MNTTITRILGWALALPVLVAAVALPVRAQQSNASSVTPHSVPLEFASARYGVTVNGKPVTVFYAAMNIHFASFDFTGKPMFKSRSMTTITTVTTTRNSSSPMISGRATRLSAHCRAELRLEQSAAS
jgi:hypothetical protein